MKKISILDIINKHISMNSLITINGWVRTRRDSKIGISFLSINDGSCLSSLQIVVNKNLSNYNQEILHLTTGCSVEVTGILIKSIGKKQNFEIKATNIKVLGWIINPETYPMSAKKHHITHLRKFAHLRARTNLIGSIVRIRHILMQSAHNFMHENGFLWIPTPIITTLDTEGTGQMFRVSTLNINKFSCCENIKNNYCHDFFGKEAFLTVSGQLNGESYACALSKIYTFGPVFRAENSNTTKHLAEFWMMEVEIAFISLNDMINFIESFLKHIFINILDKCYDDLIYLSAKNKKNLIQRLKNFIRSKIIQMEYIEIINILKKNEYLFNNKVIWGINLSSEHESFLTEKYFQSPILIKNFPKEHKAFYMRKNDDNKTVASIDLLFPNIGEVIGGSQREERLLELDNRLLEFGLNKENYWWYRDLRKYGTVPHSGFGLGVERLTSYITGIENIKDIIPFPRSPNNANF